VTIGGKTASVTGINKVYETASNGQKIAAYLIQTEFPPVKYTKDYIKIEIALNDAEMGEKGESSLFWQFPKGFKDFKHGLVRK
jgi:hypothetical protein